MWPEHPLRRAPRAPRLRLSCMYKRCDGSAARPGFARAFFSGSADRNSGYVYDFWSHSASCTARQNRKKSRPLIWNRRIRRISSSAAYVPNAMTVCAGSPVLKRADQSCICSQVASYLQMRERWVSIRLTQLNALRVTLVTCMVVPTRAQRAL